MKHAISALVNRWPGLFVLVVLVGCTKVSLQECSSFSSRLDEQSGVIICQDSIKVSTPYFVTVVANKNRRLVKLNTKHEEHQGFLEIGPDSVMINLGERQFICYPLSTKNNSWDSILVERNFLDDSTTVASFIRLERNGNVRIEGEWGRNRRSCINKAKLKYSNALVNELIREFNVISKNNFSLISTPDSDGITYLRLTKCREGKCEIFSGDYLPFGYSTIQSFLENPAYFTICI